MLPAVGNRQKNVPKKEPGQVIPSLSPTFCSCSLIYKQAQGFGKLTRQSISLPCIGTVYRYILYRYIGRYTYNGVIGIQYKRKGGYWWDKRE